MTGRVRRALGAPAGRWRRSLRFRVVAITVVGSTIVLGLVVPLLLAQIRAGVLGAKERSAVAEATAARAEAQRLVDAASNRGQSMSPASRIDAVVAAVAARGSGSGLFEVLVLSSRPRGLGVTPERGTNLVSETSVPRDLREVVSGSQRQAWAYTEIRYTDGSRVPGLVVGAPLDVPGIGPYEVYQLFPLAQEQATLDLVRNDTTVAGLLLVAGLAGLAAIVTFTLVKPVNDAARASRRVAAGNLEARMPVSGEDDLAQLAMSFNEMAGSLQEHIGALQNLSQVQQRFVADVSHELRTPLTTVRMAADMLHDRRDALAPEDARTVELLQGQLDRFETLLVDLLEVSRADAGAVHLDLSDSDLVVLVSRVVSSLQPVAAELGSSLELRAPQSLVLVCDARRVERIVANLVSNAIEHGEGRPVQVSVSVAGQQAQVVVRDEGIGLAPHELEQVFQRFWRADPARARRMGGTGLGLSIALGDAKAHGGTLTAHGALGQGATFTLSLPMAGSAVSGQLAAPTRTDKPQGLPEGAPEPLVLEGGQP